jgi:hypothetical protein
MQISVVFIFDSEQRRSCVVVVELSLATVPLVAPFLRTAADCLWRWRSLSASGAMSREKRVELLYRLWTEADPPGVMMMRPTLRFVRRSRETSSTWLAWLAFGAQSFVMTKFLRRNEIT